MIISSIDIYTETAVNSISHFFALSLTSGAFGRTGLHGRVHKLQSSWKSVSENIRENHCPRNHNPDNRGSGIVNMRGRCLSIWDVNGFHRYNLPNLCMLLTTERRGISFLSFDEPFCMGCINLHISKIGSPPCCHVIYYYFFILCYASFIHSCYIADQSWREKQK